VRNLKRKDMEDVNLLEVVPVRVAEAERAEDGRVVILRPLPTGTWPRRWLDRLLYEMSTKRIRLDVLGSAAWYAMDGKRTVGEVAQVLRAEFGEEADEAEERLSRLVTAFRSQEFVAFRGIDPEADQPG
jgi:hypothetical protein